MTTFTFQDTEISELAKLITPAGVDVDESAADRLARAAWTQIAQPGSTVTGAVLEATTPAGALEALIGDGSLMSIRAEISDEEIAAAVATWRASTSRSGFTAMLAKSARLGLRFLIPSDPEYPAGLADLGTSAPFGLWARGDIVALEQLDRAITVTGCRASSGLGESVTQEFVSELVREKIAVVTTPAYGIDGTAARAAVAAGAAPILVGTGGIDRTYPTGHAELVNRIVTTGGVFVSESPADAPPTRMRFLASGRITAALSGAVVIVQAGRRSGSLGVAAHARALGRPVGAVPGSVNDMAASGTNAAIRAGEAQLLTSSADAIALLG